MPVSIVQRPIWYGVLFYAALILLLLAIFFAGFLLNNMWVWGLGLLYLSYDAALLLFVFVMTCRLKAPLVQQGRLPSVAVIIPAHNEVSIIANCLDAVLAQNIAIKTVLIADDGSTDHSPQLLAQQYGIPQGMGWQQSTQHACLGILRLAHQGKAHVLNAAWQQVSADIIVTLDADTVLEPNALHALAQAFAQQPDLVVAGGVLHPQCRSGRLGAFFQFFQQYEYIYSFISRAGWMKANALLLVSGAFAAYRQEVLQVLGGFDATSMVEDYEINHRVYRYAYEHHQAWTVGVVARARAVTDAPVTVHNFLWQRRRWFAGFLETQFSHVDMTANPRFGIMGCFMLPIKAMDAIQPILGVVALGLLSHLLWLQSPALVWVLWIVLIKLGVDMLFNLWCLYLFSRWTQQPLARGMYLQAVVYTVLTPFSFQWLRLVGACLGWKSYLSKHIEWTAQRE